VKRPCLVCVWPVRRFQVDLSELGGKIRLTMPDLMCPSACAAGLNVTALFAHAGTSDRYFLIEGGSAVIEIFVRNGDYDYIAYQVRHEFYVVSVDTA